ncbi:O-antigen ligase family protein [Patescibacteria group bacterium]
MKATFFQGNKIVMPLVAVVIIGTAAIVGITSILFSPLVALGLVLGVAVSIVIARFPLVGLLLIAVFLPFERIGAYEFQGLTIRISQIFLVITTVVCVGRIIILRERSVWRNPYLFFIALFILINIISLYNVQNIERSLVVLVFTVFTMVLAWLLPTIIKNEQRLRQVIYALLASAFIVSAFGIFQFLGDMVGLPETITGLRDLYTKDVLGFPRIQSTAYEPLYFANYLLIPLGVALALFLSKSRAVKHSFLLVLLLTGGISFVLTVSRGAYLGLAAALLVISIYFFKRVFTLRNLIIIPLAVVIIWWVVVQTLGFGGEIFNQDKFQEHVSGVFFGASYNERIYTFEQAGVAWSEHPIIGIGVGAFGPYTSTHPYVVPTDGWKIVNNELIEILAETGILGLASFLLFAMFLIVRSIHAIRVVKNDTLRALMIGLLAAWVGVLVQYQTFSTLYIMHIWFLVGLMIVVQQMILSKPRTIDTSSQ